MSSVFTCNVNFDKDSGLYQGRYIRFYNSEFRAYKVHSTSPILRGASNNNDHQHPGNDVIHNYTSYIIKRIEVKGFVISYGDPTGGFSYVPDYVVLMKGVVSPTVNPHNWSFYTFATLRFFLYYRSRQNVLGSSILPVRYGKHQYFSIIYNEPFYLGPNEGIFMDYLVHGEELSHSATVQANAKVWFDIA